MTSVASILDSSVSRARRAPCRDGRNPSKKNRSVGNAATDMTQKMTSGVLQADGSRAVEPRMNVENVADAVVFMAGLPLDSNVLTMTVMATKMPFVGRG